MADLRIVRGLKADDPRYVGEVVRWLSSDDRSIRTSALECVAAAYAGPITSFIERHLRDSPELVGEVWTDTLTRVYARAPEYDAAKSRFATWVFNQARFALLDTRRRERRAPPSLPAAEGAVDDLAELPTPLAASEVEGLRRAFRQLSKTERELLWWRFVEGWSPSEIASTLLAGDLPPAHVRVYIARALTKLRRGFTEETHHDHAVPALDRLV